MTSLPTDPDLPDQTLLDAYGRDLGDDRWSLPGDRLTGRSRESALAVIRICLTLGQPVNAILAAETMWTLVQRVTRLEQDRQEHR